MYKKIKLPLFIFLLTCITAIIYLYPFISFNKINISTSTSYTIPILEINDTTTTLTPFYNENPNKFLIRTTEKALFNQYKRSYDILFLNEPTEPISYSVIPLQTDPVQNIVVGVVNDEAISSIHYYDHVGAIGVITLLNDNNKLISSGDHTINQHPQFFIIDGPFKNGTLIGKNVDGTEQFSKAIIFP